MIEKEGLMKKCNEGLGLLIMSFAVFFGLAILVIILEDNIREKSPFVKINHSGAIC